MLRSIGSGLKWCRLFWKGRQQENLSRVLFVFLSRWMVTLVHNREKSIYGLDTTDSDGDALLSIVLAKAMWKRSVGKLLRSDLCNTRWRIQVMQPKFN